MLFGTVRALCREHRDSETHRTLGGVREWPRRPARGLLLGARSLEEDAHGRRAPAARLSAVLAAAAALSVRGSSEAGQERGERTRSGRRAPLAQIRGAPREHGRVGPDGHGIRGPLRALQSSPGTGGPLSAGVAAAERTCAGGHAPVRSLVPSGVAAGPPSPRSSGTSQPPRPEFAARSRQDGAAGPGSARSPAPPAWSSPPVAAAAAAVSAGAGNGRGRPAGALPRRLHLRWGLAGLRRARAGGAAWGPARLDAEPVSAALAALPELWGAVTWGWGGGSACPGSVCGFRCVPVELCGLEKC